VTAIATPTTVIEPRQRLLRFELGAVWDYRELLYFLVWRDVKLRYAQTAMGAAWAVVQPVLTMVIFTIIFSYWTHIPSDGIPYPLFSFAALLPWTYFARATERSANSLVNNAQLVSKVYFPRVIVPISAVGAPLLDFAVAFTFLIGMMIWYGVAPTWGILVLPAFLLMAVLTALAVSLFLSALNVRYRDVMYVIPFMTQIWMFASPVVYPVSVVPERWRGIYSLNPMAGVIEGFRWALLGAATPDFRVIAVSGLAIVVALAGGLLYFNRLERSFADFI
jgi:lipopolysaccharide transport system permease protein